MDLKISDEEGSRDMECVKSRVEGKVQTEGDDGKEEVHRGAKEARGSRDG